MLCACQKRVITETYLNDYKTDGQNGGIVSYTYYDRLIVFASHYPALIKSSLVNFNCVCNTCMFCPCQKTAIMNTHLNDSNRGLKWRARLNCVSNTCFVLARKLKDLFHGNVVIFIKF